MAITKRVNVTFDLKIVFSTSEVEEFAKTLIADSKKFMAGEKLSGQDFEAARIAAEKGLDEAIGFMIKSRMKGGLNEGFKHDSASVGNVRVVVKS